MSNYKSAIDESCLQHQNGIFPAARETTLNAIVNIALGQNQRPISLMSDQFCEELSFSTLLPTGKFGFNADRDVPLSVIKYGNCRLLNHNGRFASNPEYLFFMQYVIEQNKVANSFSIALRNIQGQGMTAGSLRSGMQHLENMEDLENSDRAFVFLQKIPGSPSYWKKFQSEVLTVVK